MKYMYAILISVLLSACSHGPQWHSAEQQTPETTATEQSSTQDYSRMIAQQLMGSARGIANNQRVVVTSPVWLDSDFQSSPLIGRQLQEEISAELHRLSLQVVEFKMTDAVRVTHQGDFALSKDYLELRELQAADYVLAGTMVEQKDGIVINARLIDFHNQIIRATAQVTLPQHLVERIRAAHGVELVGLNSQ